MRSRTVIVSSSLLFVAVPACTPFSGSDSTSPQAIDGGGDDASSRDDAASAQSDGGAGTDAGANVDPLVNPQCVVGSGSNGVTISIIPPSPKPGAAFQVTVNVTPAPMSIASAPLVLCTPAGAVGPIGPQGDTFSGSTVSFAYVVDAGVATSGTTQAQFTLDPGPSYVGAKSFVVGN